MSDRRPKLEIPISNDIMDLEHVEVEVLYNSPKLQPSQNPNWSDSHMYSVSVNGVEHVLFATESLHEKIQETGAIKGTVVSISRYGTGTDTRWGARYVSGPQEFSQGNDDPGDFTDQEDEYNRQQDAHAASQYAGRREYTYEDVQQDTRSVGPHYKSLENEEVIEQIVRDNLSVYLMIYQRVKENVPVDQDGSPLWDEERIGAVVTNQFIALQQTVNYLTTGRYGIALSEINRFQSGKSKPKRAAAKERDEFADWFKSLPGDEQEAYRATSMDKFLHVIRTAVGRYSDNSFGAKGAVGKFTDEVPLGANRGDGLTRVLLLRRTRAYAKERDKDADSTQAMMRAIEQVPALEGAHEFAPDMYMHDQES